ncbi:MAG: Pvc16 family protein [Candidatus Binataceae bacterium]
MALNTLGVLDLSFVTDRLTDLLNGCVDKWPFWAPTPPGGGSSGEIPKFHINVTGAAPDTVRSVGGCQLSLYLFHVTPDSYQRNSPVVGPRAQPIPAQPLSLDLYYLLSAFAPDDYHQEQQAMSIAMRCFHEHPIVRMPVPIPVAPPPAPLQFQPEEFTLTMEVETVDSLSRLWQSVTSSMRLAAVYKASIVFMTPPVPVTALAKAVQQINLGVDPAALPFAANGQLIGAYRKVRYISPSSAAASQPTLSYDSSAPTVAAGQTLILYGAGFSDGHGGANQTAKRLYLLTPAGSEQDVTTWITPDANPNPPPATIVLDSRLTIRLPAAALDPGVYQLRVGSDIASGDATTYRSNAVPIGIAPAVIGMPLPPLPPILRAGTFSGSGFISGKTEVLLEIIPLAEGPPQPGNFQITGGATIDFQPPVGLSTGLYVLRVRVNNVESDPSWWVSI